MLGKFDPLLLAYNDKSWIVNDELKSRIWRKAGHISATIVEGGKACATWDYRITTNGLHITITKFRNSRLAINKMKKHFFKIANLYECQRVECSIMGIDGRLENLYQLEVKSE